MSLLTKEEQDAAFDASMAIRPKDASNAETRRLFTDAIESAILAKLSAGVQLPEAVKCGSCYGSGRVVRDPDIGTDQECFVCEGSGIDADLTAQLQPLIAAARIREREACAKVCDEQSARSVASMLKQKTAKGRDIYSAAGQTADWMAAAIRACTGEAGS